MSDSLLSNGITKGELRTRNSARTTIYGSKKNEMKNHHEKFIFVLFYINKFQSTWMFLQFICNHNTLHTTLCSAYLPFCSLFSYVECWVLFFLNYIQVIVPTVIMSVWILEISFRSDDYASDIRHSTMQIKKMFHAK